jgi:hypothetical protein
VSGGLLLAMVVVLAASGGMGQTKTAASIQLAHLVYFKLKDGSSANRAKLLGSCKLLLSDHPGTVYFATGTLADDLNGRANDRDFDVSLLIVFASKQAHDDYQKHPKHVKFVEENLPSLDKVRVFDSYLSTTHSVSSSKSRE